MNQPRGIFKSIKNIPSQSETKKVTLFVKNSQKHIQNEFIGQQHVQRDVRRPKTVDFSKEKGMNCSSRSIKSRQRGRKVKGCLKREGSIKNMAMTEEQQIKSSKSIKFNIKGNNTFEYTIGQRAPLKRQAKKVKEKVEENCCSVY